MMPRGLKEELERWINEKKYGHLQVNFSGGKVMNINRCESVRVEAIGYIVPTSSSATTSTTTNDPKV